MTARVEALGLLGGVPFRADADTLETRLEGPGAQELLGHPPGVPLSASAFWEELVPPSDRVRVLEMLRAVAKDGRPRVVEHSAEVAGRQQVVFRTAAQREGGELAGVMLDVTAARASERHAEEIELWLATLGEALPFDFWICDRYGRVVLQNPASRERLGNALGTDARTMAPSVPSALRGERVSEEVTRSVGGEERYYTRVLSPLRQLPDGDVTGVLGVDLDVTELKRAQAELLRRERLAGLGELAAAVAHEVRNPLGAMFNAIELLRRRPRPGDEDELLGIVNEELRRLDVLVMDLFDLVRPLDARLAPQPLPQVVEDAVSDALRKSENARLVRLVRRVADPAPVVAMDSQLLNVALVNVLRNALQAMPDGGELAVEIEQEQRLEFPWAKVTVKDTGHGIPPELRERIFEPFFTTRPTGSGLGLAIVKRVIAEHHGDVEVHSERGEGTAFVLRLPCAR